MAMDKDDLDSHEASDATSSDLDPEEDFSTERSSSPRASREASLERTPETEEVLSPQALRSGLQLASRGAGSAPRSIDPLEIRFSQMKMRHLFGDGRRLADTVLQVQETRCTEVELAEYGESWKLTFPFPKIEVIRWKCKLRDPKTGRPRVDPDTGEELYDSEEQWFTLDNRRLYCLQESAMRVWPERCVAEVAVIISGPHAHMRELRKFRTLDRGKGAMIGSRADGVSFVRWSWREKAGLEESDSDSDYEVDRRTKAQAQAETLPDVRLVASKTKKAKDNNVLGHLASLKPDDCERIEISKKISWILRHGAWGSRCNIKISDDGWVLIADLRTAESLQGVGLSRLQEVIADSNKQKYRYEIRESKDGTLIRASGKKGRKQKSKPEHSREHRDNAATRESGNTGRGKGSKGDSKGGSEKVNGKAAQKAAAKAAATEVAPVVVKAPKAAASAAKDKEPKTESANDGKVGATSETAATSSRAKPKAGDWQSSARQAAASKYSGPFPPGMVPPASQSQFMMQMQAMQQMLSSPHHMQVKQQVQRLMQMRMMRQWQAMQAYQMQAHMHAMQAQHMAAVQEMQNYVEEWCREHPEEEYEEYEEEATTDSVPETAEELEAKIQEVLAAAVARNAEQQKAATQSTPAAASSSSGTSSAQPLSNLEAKIKEALEAAANRKAEEAEAKAAAWQPPAVPVRPSPEPVQETDVQAKIAQALKAAQERSSASSLAKSAPAPKPVVPPKPRPQISKAAASPDPSLSLQEQIQKALDAAKERQNNK
jgi:hypothetical protein